jgi:two-component system sensor histidine kinase QseC
VSPPSVRRRLVLALATGFAVLIVGAGVVLGDLARREATGEFDAALLAKAHAFVALTEEEAGRIELDYTPDAMPEFERADRPDYFQFWLDDGTVLLRSRRLTGDLPRAAAPATRPAFRDVRLPDGREGRLVELAYVPRRAGTAVEPGDTPEVPPEAAEPPPGGHRVVVAVARDRSRLDALLGRVRLGILAVGGLAAVLAGILVWRAVAAGLRPVDEIAAQVGRLDADRLGAHVGGPSTPTELAPIVDALNALVARLRASFERERRFTGNVAHELRTPIAELRSLAAVAGRWPGDATAVQRFFGDVGDVAGRMERVIADLLLLARCQAGVETVAGTPTNVRSLVATAWSKLAPRASEAGLRLRLDLPDDLVVESDPDKLSIVVANVLGNAVSYARPRSEIRCVGERSGPGFRLEFANEADLLTPQDLERLTEPFWRKDGARSSGEHAGLGLALVSALASLLRLDVGFAQDPDGTFRVRLARGAPRGGPEAGLAFP